LVIASNVNGATSTSSKFKVLGFDPISGAFSKLESSSIGINSYSA